MTVSRMRDAPSGGATPEVQRRYVLHVRQVGTICNSYWWHFQLRYVPL